MPVILTWTCLAVGTGGGVTGMAAIEQRMAKASGLAGEAWSRHADPCGVHTRPGATGYRP